MTSEVLSAETKFTPGPWDYGIARTDNLIDGACVAAFVDGEDVHICELTDPGSFTQMEANVHLITAAPDLYAALTLIKRFGELACVDAGASFGGTSGKKPASKDVFQFPRHLLVEIDAALTRARGGSSNEGE